MIWALVCDNMYRYGRHFGSFYRNPTILEMVSITKGILITNGIEKPVPYCWLVKELTVMRFMLEWSPGTARRGPDGASTSFVPVTSSPTTAQPAWAANCYSLMATVVWHCSSISAAVYQLTSRSVSTVALNKPRASRIAKGNFRFVAESRLTIDLTKIVM